MSSAPRRPGLIRHPDFLKLWTAETISQFGTQVSLLALPLIAAIILDVPPFEFALLATFEFLPFILLSLPAGVWVDRLRRRPILIVTDIGRAIALISVPVAVFFDVLTIWQLYVVGFAIGCMTSSSMWPTSHTCRRWSNVTTWSRATPSWRSAAPRHRSRVRARPGSSSAW